MGFGYLLLGYLITFVLYQTFGAMGMIFGSLTLMVGYSVMLLGLIELNRYHRAFAYAKWLLIPSFVTALYSFFNALDEELLLEIPIFGALAESIMNWIVFLCLILFNLALLYGVKMITHDLELSKMENAASRNMFFVSFYAFVYLFANLPIKPIEQIRSYLVLPVILINLVWVLCNLVLLLSCNKNICRAGDEEQPAKPSRFSWINRLGSAYEKNKQKAIENTTREAEEVLRRRKEKREKKKQRKRK